MPLILLCGNPCTGKTTFSHQLVAYLKEKGVTNVVLINEEAVNIDKKEGYKSTFREKSARGALKSAVDHNLNADCYVILDSLNYIKGYRYELFCTAKAFRTPHCVIWVECDDKVSDGWNAARLELDGNGFAPEVVGDLRRRFEAPNDNNRWDNPLFKVLSFAGSEEPTSSSVEPCGSMAGEHSSAVTAAVEPVAEAPKSVFKSSWKPKKPVSSGDTVVTSSNRSPATAASASPSSAVFFSGTQASATKQLADFRSPGEALPLIHAYLVDAVAPIPNSSTLTSAHADADLLYELDRTSQLIMKAIVSHQSENVEGTPLKFVEYDRELLLHRHAGLAELQRYRRQFVKMNGQHPPSTSAAVGSLFIDYLAQHL